MKNKTDYKAALLQGINQTDQLEKNNNNILGRSTLIQKPLSIIEEQFLDLQKSKKFTSNLIVSNKTNKKDESKNVFNIDSIKNSSLNIYPTHKSLNKVCTNVNKIIKFIKMKKCDEEKIIEKKFFLKTYNPENVNVKIVK